MNIDFIALEQQVFTFDMPLSLFPLYAPSGASQQNFELEKISKKVFSWVLLVVDLPTKYPGR